MAVNPGCEGRVKDWTCCTLPSQCSCAGLHVRPPLLSSEASSTLRTGTGNTVQIEPDLQTRVAENPMRTSRKNRHEDKLDLACFLLSLSIVLILNLIGGAKFTKHGKVCLLRTTAPMPQRLSKVCTMFAPIPTSQGHQDRRPTTHREIDEGHRVITMTSTRRLRGRLPCRWNLLTEVCLQILFAKQKCITCFLFFGGGGGRGANWEKLTNILRYLGVPEKYELQSWDISTPPNKSCMPKSPPAW